MRQDVMIKLIIERPVKFSWPQGRSMGFEEKVRGIRSVTLAF